MPAAPSSRPSAAATSGLRASVERASVGALTRMSQLPRAVPFLVMLGLLVVGLMVGGPLGAVLLGIVVLVVAWLFYLSWPRLTASERLGRAAVLVLALALWLTTVFPR